MVEIEDNVDRELFRNVEKLRQLLIALAGARLVHAWQRRHGELRNQPGWRARLAEGTVMLTPFLAALGVTLVVRGVLGTMSMHTLVVDTALQLILVLVLVRLGLYLLRIGLGGDSWLHRWETRLTLILWALISFELLGWFGYAEATLDRIDIIP